MNEFLSLVVRLLRAGYKVSLSPAENMIGSFASITIEPPHPEIGPFVAFIAKLDLLCPEASLDELREFVGTLVDIDESGGGENG